MMDDCRNFDNPQTCMCMAFVNDERSCAFFDHCCWQIGDRNLHVYKEMVFRLKNGKFRKTGLHNGSNFPTIGKLKWRKSNYQKVDMKRVAVRIPKILCF